MHSCLLRYAVQSPLEWLVKRMTRFCVTLPLEQIITRVKNAGEECGFAVKDTSTVGHVGQKLP